MGWKRKSKHPEVGPDGYQVCATSDGDRWRFSAWSPPAMPELSHWEWIMQNAQPHWQIGEHIPQRRTLLAVTDTALESVRD